MKKWALKIQLFDLMTIFLFIDFVSIESTGRQTGKEDALYEKRLFAFDYFEKVINDDISYGGYKYKLSLRLNNEFALTMSKASFHESIQKLLHRHGHSLLFLKYYHPKQSAFSLSNTRSLCLSKKEYALSKLLS